MNNPEADVSVRVAWAADAPSIVAIQHEAWTATLPGTVAVPGVDALIDQWARIIEGPPDGYEPGRERLPDRPALHGGSVGQTGRAPCHFAGARPGGPGDGDREDGHRRETGEGRGGQGR